MALCRGVGFGVSRKQGNTLYTDYIRYSLLTTGKSRWSGGGKVSTRTGVCVVYTYIYIWIHIHIYI